MEIGLLSNYCGGSCRARGCARAAIPIISIRGLREIMRKWCFSGSAPALAFMAAQVFGAGGEQHEFFEKQVRPLFAARCYTCHSGQVKAPLAGLRLDSRAAALRGGDLGPVIVPGKPAESRLLKAVRGELAVRMPPSGRLADTEIASIEKWIEMGAPWPDDRMATPDKTPTAFNLEERRRAHWAWQPLRPGARQSVDAYLRERLEAKGLKPAPEADRGTLIRRLAFDLTGLPPSPNDVAAFAADRSPNAYEKLVDRLLASPGFGERWARHWMDLVRYSESHGSEGDPDTPLAWRYRDYLIRAFNSDVPYDQLIREHLAGDLLAEPRINAKEHLNESVLGTAHLRMVEHGFQPVDPWEDRVKWMDNQIDVFSKAFQGLTVSCARCHDHKFDAISQKDFYALFGIFSGARPTQVAVDLPSYLDRNRTELARLKAELRPKLAEAWLLAARRLPERLLKNGLDAQAMEDAPCNLEIPLYAWYDLRGRTGADFRQAWAGLAAYWGEEIARRKEFNSAQLRMAWDLTGADYQTWLKQGTGAPAQAAPAGEFALNPNSEKVVSAIYPAGVYTHLLSAKHHSVIQSPRFKIESEAVSVRMLGGNLSFAQLIVEDYAVPRGGIYHMRFSPKREQMGWATWDVTYWKGFTAYVEFATRDDVTYFEPDRRKAVPGDDGRSWFGAQRVVFHSKKQRPREEVLPILALLAGPAPQSPEELARGMASRLAAAIQAWRDGRLGEVDASYLDFFVQKGILPNTTAELGAAAPLVAEYRRLEQQVPVARRAPGVLEESAPDQPLLVRGNPKNPGERVPRHFLTALDGRMYEDPRTVRLRLAEDVARTDNPLTARVMVNRIWYYLFRHGLVRTVDNFGKLGDPPTHPELLDWLARRLIDEGWSIKKMVRLLATSEAYRMSGEESAEAKQADPGNELVHHMPVRRLEAEEIRDAILAVSGELDPAMFGPSVPVYYAHEKGQTKGDRDKGPLDGNGRRSIYLEIRRNAANPFLEVFDAPKPSTTRGARDITNVPAQSLALMNSPFVIDQAEKWARRLLTDRTATADDRVTAMFERALGRKPSPEERDQAATFLSSLESEHSVKPGGLLKAVSVWRDFAEAIWNFKEFVYVR